MFVRFDKDTIQIRHPRIWLIVLANIIGPGLGACYLGHVWRALLWMTLFMVGSIAYAGTKLFGSAAGVGHIWVGVMVVITAASMYDSFRLAKAKAEETDAFRVFLVAQMPNAVSLTEGNKTIISVTDPPRCIRQQLMDEYKRCSAAGTLPPLHVPSEYVGAGVNQTVPQSQG